MQMYYILPLYTLGPMQVNSILDLTLSDFFNFSATVTYSITSFFHNFQWSLMFPLKLSSCRGLNLSVSGRLLLLKKMFTSDIMSRISKKVLILKAIIEYL